MTNLPADTPGSATDVAVSRAAGTGPATWATGMLSERLAGAEETAGLPGASVITQPPGQASPLHVHTREAEAWFLLAGAMTCRAGEQRIRMTAGDFIYLPREVPHAFRTTGTIPARFPALTLPGGLPDIYHEAGVPAAERHLPEPGVPDADVARWLALAPRYGLRVVGPPIPEAEARRGDRARRVKQADASMERPRLAAHHRRLGSPPKLRASTPRASAPGSSGQEHTTHIFPEVARPEAQSLDHPVTRSAPGRTRLAGR
jgi:mannose-6-phosphate isomerase-like protein (cupin superfamily)